MDQAAFLDRDAIQAAASVLIAEEQRPEMKTFLAFLLQYIDREMYS